MTMSTLRPQLSTPFAVLFGAALIAGAVLFNGWAERTQVAAMTSTPFVKKLPVDKQSVAEQFSAGVRAGLINTPNRNYVLGKPRRIVEVAVDDVRFSKDDAQLLVDFSLLCDDRAALRGSVVLAADEFGVYHGELPIDNKTAPLAIK